jgi:hypothetical protein
LLALVAACGARPAPAPLSIANASVQPDAPEVDAAPSYCHGEGPRPIGHGTVELIVCQPGYSEAGPGGQVTIESTLELVLRRAGQPDVRTEVDRWTDDWEFPRHIQLDVDGDAAVIEDVGSNGSTSRRAFVVKNGAWAER